MDSSPLGPSPWNSPGKNARVGWYSLLQGVFLTQGWNPGLLHCRQILYCLSYQESPLPKTCNTSHICVSFLCRATLLQCSHFHCLISKHFHHSKVKLCSHQWSVPVSPPLWPDSHSSTSVSRDLPLLGISYKWNHTMCGLLSFSVKFQSSSVLSHVTSLHFCGLYLPLEGTLGLVWSSEKLTCLIWSFLTPQPPPKKTLKTAAVTTGWVPPEVNGTRKPLLSLVTQLPLFPDEATEAHRGFPVCLQLLQNTLGLSRVKRNRSHRGVGRTGWRGRTQRGPEIHPCLSLENHPPAERNMKPNAKIYIWDFQVFRRQCKRDTFIER